MEIITIKVIIRIKMVMLIICHNVQLVTVSPLITKRPS